MPVPVSITAPVANLAAALERDQRLVAAILFGSAARGQLRPDSDIDVAVLPRDRAAAESLTADPLDTLGTLGLAAGRDVHLVLLPQADTALRRSIMRTGQELFDRSDGALRALKVDTLLQSFDEEYLRRLVDESQRRQLAGVESPRADDAGRVTDG